MAQFIKYTKTNPTKPQAEGAQSGGLVIYPTDTVYGLVVTLPIPKLWNALQRLKDKTGKANFSFYLSFKQFVRLCSTD
jgi:tRNA A37 threonylcarbamoyladenosine synthetase subunit TsaC/SUA5/YrdC